MAQSRQNQEAHPPGPEFTLHDRCLKARRDAGLTQEELAERTASSARTVTRYETGDVVHPRAQMLKAWAAACEVDYHWLRYGNASGGDVSLRYQHLVADLQELEAA